MACFSPLTGYRPRDGKKKLTFKKTEGYTDKPVKVSCGQCRGCRLEKARQWAVRCVHEAQMHTSNSFLTLTYSDEHLPCDRSIDIKAMQRFIKRVRKSYGPLRYYHCGEYGENATKRPHYHMLAFGQDFRSDRELLTVIGGNPVYTSPKLDKLWGLGHAVIGELTQQSAAYCARYTMKKLGGDLALDEYGERVDCETGEVNHYRKPPYSSMSLKPGIGSTWLAKYKPDVYPRDEVIVDGRKTKPPAFYDYVLEAENPKLLETIKLERRRNGMKHKTNNTHERLAVREEVLRLKTIHYSRDSI